MRLSNYFIGSVVLAVYVFRYGDAQITGWTKPSTISDASGTATDISKDEDTALNAEVAEFEATPTGQDTISKYELLTTGTPFELSSPAGILTLKSALNYETTQKYVIEVKATDSASNVGTATVTILINDVNEAPKFGETNFEICVLDESTEGTKVTTLSATDPDTGNIITYTVNSGDDNSDFKISTDELQVNTGKTLDMVTTPSYTLVIHATDDGTPAESGSATFTVKVESSCNGAATLGVTFLTIVLTLLVTFN